MSGLISNLNLAAKALNAQSKGVEIAGRNLANVNNPNYARQRVELSDRGELTTNVGSQTMGVEATGITAIRNQFLDGQVLRETSQTALLQAQRNQLAKGQSLLGESIDRSSDSAFLDGGSTSGSLSSSLNSFFAGFDNLAARPTDAGAKLAVLQNARQLADRFNTIDSRLSTLQGDITAEAGADTATAGSLLQEVASLNADIQRLEANRPGAAVDLRNARQAKLEELSKYLDFTTRPIPGVNGGLQVVARDTSAAEVVLVDGPNAASVTFDGNNVLANGATLALGGGSIAGHLAARDGSIQTLRNNLRDAAIQLAGAVNAAYNPTGSTGNFFQVPPTAPNLLTLDPLLSAASLKTTDTANAGANELALAVAGAGRQTFSGGGGDTINGTIPGFLAQTVSSFGYALAQTDSSLSDQETIQRFITAQRAEVSGVSMDEELTDLMRFQRAFQANSRVINVIDELLDQVVNRLGG